MHINTNKNMSQKSSQVLSQSADVIRLLFFFLFLVHFLWSYTRSVHCQFYKEKNNVNPHLPYGPVDPYQLDESISILGVSGVLFHLIIFQIDIPVSKQWRP